MGIGQSSFQPSSKGSVRLVWALMPRLENRDLGAGLVIYVLRIIPESQNSRPDPVALLGPIRAQAPSSHTSGARLHIIRSEGIDPSLLKFAYTHIIFPPEVREAIACLLLSGSFKQTVHVTQKI